MSLSRIHWKNLPASSLAQDRSLLTNWDRLNAAHGDLPFLSGDAIISALNILGAGNERLLVGRKDGGVLAMFLLSPQAGFRWQTFQPSQLPLGAWVAEANATLQDIARSLLRGPLGPCL
ncbi:MAG: hypothetical protein IPI20_19010 [Rhodoferax sp.]|nr:hypothetical protein [Rhodoferax sp.]